MDPTREFVINDGTFIGDFEGLYRAESDPWQQSTEASVQSSRRRLAVHWAKRLKANRDCNRVVDIGCGHGHLAGELARDGFGVVGVDVSETAIQSARERYREPTFLHRRSVDEGLLHDADPDIIIMCEVTWYMLDTLPPLRNELIKYAQSRSRPTYLIHLLETYAECVQQYGREYFTDLDSILEWWNVPWIEAGTIETQAVDGLDKGRGTYFVARLT